MIKRFFCPVNGWDCPYWKKDGTCTLENAVEECEDAMMFWGEDGIFAGEDPYEYEEEG